MKEQSYLIPLSEAHTLKIYPSQIVSLVENEDCFCLMMKCGSKINRIPRAIALELKELMV